MIITVHDTTKLYGDLFPSLFGPNNQDIDYSKLVPGDLVRPALFEIGYFTTRDRSRTLNQMSDQIFGIVISVIHSVKTKHIFNVTVMWNCDVNVLYCSDP